MTIWIDAQLSPALAVWFRKTLEVNAVAVRDLQLRDVTDPVIFEAARQANVIVLTKDGDFVRLLERRGPPPQIVWLRQYLERGSPRDPRQIVDDCRGDACQR